MAVWSYLYRNGLWVSVPLFVAGALLLRYFILGVISLGDRNRIVSVGLLERQDIEFPDTGQVILCVEGPLFTRRFSDLDFELSTGDEVPVKGHRRWFRTSSSGLSKMRMEWRSYEISYRGRHILRIKGLGNARVSDPEHHIVFMRPHLAQSVGYILGILLAAGLLIGGLVLFLLRLTLRE